jgi:hypothetical protein
MARAERLGLSYRRYAIILLCGSDVEGILFAGGSVIGRAGEATGRDQIGGKLAAISDCQLLLLACGKDIRLFERTDPERHALFDALVPVPSPRLLAHPPSKPDRYALRTTLQKQALASRTVILVGKGDFGSIWVAAARLAGFVTAGEYFVN